VGPYTGYENKIIVCNFMNEFKYDGPDALCVLFMLVEKHKKGVRTNIHRFDIAARTY
jgi:hypothetical protein